MKLQVITPTGMLLEKEIERVTVPGSAGSFTILRGHAPIISTLTPGKAVYSAGGSENAINITSGVVHAADNIIKITGLCEK